MPGQPCVAAPPPNEIYPLPVCVNGVCSVCGPDKVFFSAEENNSPEFQNWNKFAKAPHKTVDRDKKEVIVEMLQLIKNRTTPRALIEEFQLQAKKYVQHRFEKAWQQSTFECAYKDLAPKSLLVWLDFSENLGLEHNLAPQSLHWVKRHVSVLCCVCVG